VLEADLIVADGASKLRVVRDEHDRNAPAGFLADHGEKPLGRGGVEPCGRLVEKEQARGVDQGARQGDSLALAARVRARRAIRERIEIKARRGAREGPSWLVAVQHGGELDVLPPAEVWVAKRIVPEPAECGADLLPRPTQVAMIDPS